MSRTVLGHSGHFDAKKPFVFARLVLGHLYDGDFAPTNYHQRIQGTSWYPVQNDLALAQAVAHYAQ